MSMNRVNYLQDLKKELAKAEAEQKALLKQYKNKETMSAYPPIEKKYNDLCELIEALGNKINGVELSLKNSSKSTVERISEYEQLLAEAKEKERRFNKLLMGSTHTTPDQLKQYEDLCAYIKKLDEKISLLKSKNNNIHKQL